ncbi:MAG: hypothetical protein ACMG6S_20815, partial [Byssovorax sp.]
GSSWEEIAREKGITIDQARYLYEVAVEKMEAALQRADAKRTKRRILAFPILLAHFFDALRSDVDNVSPELDRRVREGLELFMASARSSEAPPESERLSFARPAVSILVTAPLVRPPGDRPQFGRPRGLASAIVLACLLQGAPLDEPSPEPKHAASIPDFATAEPAEQRSGTGSAAPRLPANGSRAIPGALLPEGTRAARRGSAMNPLKVGSSWRSRRLLDRVRVALQTGDARAALTRLAQHARCFPDMDVADRRDVRQSICAAPAVSSAPECASPASSIAAP